MAESWADLGKLGAPSTPDSDWSDLGAPVQPRSLGRRFVDNIGDAIERSGLGQQSRRIDNGDGQFTAEDLLSVRVRKGGLIDRGLSALGLEVGTDDLTPSQQRERERRANFEARSQADPFYRAPGGVLGRAAAGAASLAGQFTGAALSPENWVAPGKTIVQRAAGNAAVGAGADVLLQGGDIGAGVQDEYSPLQTAGAGLAGAAISVGADAAVAGGRAAARGAKRAAGRVADRLVPDQSLDAATSVDGVRPADIPTRADWSDLGKAASPAKGVGESWADLGDAAAAPVATRSGPQPPTATVRGQSGRISQAMARSHIEQIAPGARITSGARTPEHNRAVGGAPNSWHISGQAADFVPPKGMTLERFRAELKARGLPITELLDEGDHFHWAWGRKGGAAHAEPAGEPSSGWNDGLPEQPFSTIPDAEDGGFTVDFAAERGPDADNPIPATPAPRAPDAPATPEPSLTDRALDAMRRGERVRVDQGPSLAEYLARSGGLNDLGGELSRLDADAWHRARPFMNRLVRENGLTLGDAEVKAQEAGFLPERFGDDTDNRATPQDLLDAIRDELAGKPRYARDDPANADLRQHIEDLDEVLTHLELDPARASNAEIKAAIARLFSDPETVSGQMAKYPEPAHPSQAAPSASPYTAVPTMPLAQAMEPPVVRPPDLPDLDNDVVPARLGMAPRRTPPSPEGLKRLRDALAEPPAESTAAAPRNTVEFDAVMQAASRPPHEPAPERAHLAPVSRWLGEAARNHGLDLSGYKHSIDASAVRHIRRAHGAAERERPRGQLEITDADLRAISDVVASPDKVVFGTKNPRGLDQVIYLKEMPDGSVLHLEEVRTGRRELAAISMRKYPATIDDAKLARILSPNGRTDGGDNLRIIDGPSGSNPTGKLAALRSTAERRGLRDAPGVQAVAAGDAQATGRAGFRGENVAQMVTRLRATLGLTARQGRVTNRRALGEYDPRTGVIRTRIVHEVDVLSHEGGHHLEGLKLPSLMRALKVHEGALKQLAYEGAPLNVLRQEGFAEFFRWYVTNPDHARRIAPEFYDAFEQALGADAPQVLGELRTLQQGYQAYLQAPSSGVVSSQIVRSEPQTWLTRRLAALKAGGVRDSVRALADEAYAATSDRFHPVNVAVRELKRIAAGNGRPIGELKTTQNPYRLARMAAGAYSSGHMDLMGGVVPYHGVDPEGPSLRDALVKALGKEWAADSETDFGGYLISRRMVHEYARFERGELKNPPDGLSLDAHEQAIRDFEAAHPTWREAAGMVHAFTERLWKKRYEGGLIGEETYRSGLDDHPFYVPAMRDLSDKDRTPFRPTSGTGKFAGGVHQFKGSTRAFINPIQSIMREAYDLNAMLARNDVLKTLEDLANRAGVGAGAIVERLPAKELRPVHVDAMDAAEAAAQAAGLGRRDVASILENLQAELGENTHGVVFESVPINERGEPIVYMWRGGEKIPLRLPDGDFGRSMFTALAGMTPQQKSLFLDTFAFAARVQRTGIVTHPAFMFANFIRDQLSAWILTDVGYKPFVTGARGIADQIAGSKLADRYSAMGGIMGGANVSSLGDGRSLKPRALKADPKSPARFMSWRGVSHFIELSETGTRLGLFRLAYAKAKRSGLSDYDAFKDAAFEARDYLDNDLHGSRMLWARRIFPFMNANIQGQGKGLRVLTANGTLLRTTLAPLLKGPPATAIEKALYLKAVKAWAKVSVLGVLGLGLTALYRDDPEYQEFDDRERATHWFAKLGGTWVRAPKPFELATLSNLFERAFEAQAEKDPTAWERLAKGLRHVLIPPVQTPVVTVPFEIASNKDYAGRPIVPESLRGKVDPEMQFNSYTSELGKFLGRVLRASPAVIDHAISGFGGTWGRDAENLSNMVRPAEQRRALSIEDMPVAQRFTSAPERGSASAAEFWGLIAAEGGKWTKAEGTFRAHLKATKDAAAISYLRKLDKPVQAYVMSQVFSEKGSGKLHPLARAKASNAVIGDLRRDLMSGEVLGSNGRPIRLTAVERRDADRALAQLQLAEIHNGLKASGVEGWAQQEYLPRAKPLKRLGEVSPTLAQLLEFRMAAAKVPPVRASVARWPVLQGRLEAMSDDMVRRLLAKERMQSSTTRLDERLRRLGARNLLGEIGAGGPSRNVLAN